MIAMPTVLRIGQYRFHFYSNEMDEPAHIHISTSDGECKFWLSPILLAKNRDLPPYQLREIERLVFEHKQFLLEKYDEYHNR